MGDAFTEILEDRNVVVYKLCYGYAIFAAKERAILILVREKHPIKANPAKAGDAKLWVYCSKTATTARPPKITNHFLCLYSLADFQSGYFFRVLF